MACELQRVNIPYAINADTQFYDGEEGAWRPALEPRVPHQGQTI